MHELAGTQRTSMMLAGREVTRWRAAVECRGPALVREVGRAALGGGAADAPPGFAGAAKAAVALAMHVSSTAAEAVLTRGRIR